MLFNFLNDTINGVRRINQLTAPVYIAEYFSLSRLPNKYFTPFEHDDFKWRAAGENCCRLHEYVIRFKYYRET